MIENLQQPIRFDGPDYDPKKDLIRLTGQLLRVYNCMKDSRWRSLAEIENITGDPQASISAQLRHLRKDRFGRHIIGKRRKSKGTFEYQLIINTSHDENKGTDTRKF